MASVIKCEAGCVGQFHTTSCPNMLLTGLGADGKGGAMHVRPEPEPKPGKHQLSGYFQAACSGEHADGEDHCKAASQNITSLISMMALWLSQSPDFLEAFRAWLVKSGFDAAGVTGGVLGAQAAGLLNARLLAELVIAIDRSDLMTSWRKENGPDVPEA